MFKKKRGIRSPMFGTSYYPPEYTKDSKEHILDLNKCCLWQTRKIDSSCFLHNALI